MSKVLRINWIQAKDHRGWQERYDLVGRLVAIIGPIDRGKSSMADCIGFLFGRAVTFKAAVDQNLLAVRAEVRIGAGTFTLHRDRQRAGYVHIQDAAGDDVGIFPIKAGESEQSLSDWLLAQLELDDTFASVRLPGDAKTLDFAADMLPYLHIRQEDIDRFVIRPQTNPEDNARVAVAKLLLFLSSPKLERLEARVHDLTNRIKKLQNTAREIRGFLNSAEVTQGGSLDDALGELRTSEEQAERLVQSLKGEASAATKFAEHRKEEVEKARARFAAAETTVDKALRRHRNSVDEVAALDESLRELAEAETASPTGQDHLEFEYSHCPACRSELADRVVPAGHCSLCAEVLPGSARGAEKARLQQVRRQTAQHLDRIEVDLASARRTAESARDRLDNAREAVDEQTSEAVTPYVDAITHAATDLESISSRRTTLERLRAQLTQREAEITNLKDKLQSTSTEQNQVRAELNEPDAVLGELNELFGHVVHAFGLPWETGHARLNPDTLLPMVDEQDFEKRGGGSRTAVSVAYSLTLLMYALEYPALFQLPSLLILDSPQKNLGHNEHDLAARIYTWIGDYFEQRRRSIGGRYETFQLIVVDNDLPDQVREHFDTVVNFAGETGFIRDLDHPHGRPEAPRQLELGGEDAD